MAERPKLFEYAVLYHPKSKRDDLPQRSEIVVVPTHVLAKSEQEAVINASRAIPSEHLDHLEDVEIIIRPF